MTGETHATSIGSDPDGDDAVAGADSDDGALEEGRADRPRPLPLVGNLHQITRDPLAFLATARGHDLMPYRTVTERCYVVAHPEGVRTVLVDDADAYRKGEMMRRRVGSLLGDGIFLAEGENWQGQRTTMQPAFYRERIAGYADAMVDRSAAVADWEDGTVVDVAEVAREVTLAVLSDTLLGIDPGSDRAVVARAADAIADRYDSRRIGAFLPEWIPSPTNRRYRRSLAALRRTIDRIIEERTDAVGAGDELGTDLLSILVAAAADGGMDDETLRDNLVTFLFAGHETTALGLTYALHSLATHPGEQARVLEALEAFGDVTAAPEVAAAPEALPAVDRVVSETLRLYPPVPLFFREPTRPVDLLGTRVPEGTVLAMSPWTCHRDPRWWDEPETFRPDRWAQQAEGATPSSASDRPPRPEYAYFPFGGGPRHCIGMRFALLELRLALATFLSRYRFEPVTETLSFAPSATLQPDSPVKLRVRRR